MFKHERCQYFLNCAQMSQLLISQLGIVTPSELGDEAIDLPINDSPITVAYRVGSIVAHFESTKNVQ